MSLKETLNDYDIELDDNQIDLLLKYMDLVLEKNFVYSLYVLNLFDFEENKTIIDVGTGAGFPAIPIKIARNDLKFTLLDSLRKRVDFLKDVIDELHLTDIKAVHERAEECTNAIKILGGKIEQTIDYKIDDEDRSLVVIKKIKETPKKYPRGGGKPKKNPL